MVTSDKHVLSPVEKVKKGNINIAFSICSHCLKQKRSMKAAGIMIMKSGLTFKGIITLILNKKAINLLTVDGNVLQI